MKLNLKAFELRVKLFNLLTEFKSLQFAAEHESLYDAAGQIEGVACRLAEIHSELPDVFTDAARDEKDQEHKAILED